ncbi:MAG: hypothetical protein ACOYUZ_01265 [Patescibacteria group bacterium]
MQNYYREPQPAPADDKRQKQVKQAYIDDATKIYDVCKTVNEFQQLMASAQKQRPSHECYGKFEIIINRLQSLDDIKLTLGLLRNFCQQKDAIELKGGHSIYFAPNETIFGYVYLPVTREVRVVLHREWVTEYNRFCIVYDNDRDSYITYMLIDHVPPSRIDKPIGIQQQYCDKIAVRIALHVWQTGDEQIAQQARNWFLEQIQIAFNRRLALAVRESNDPEKLARFAREHPELTQ